jgi:glycosyltransferase involved in cell wall biosynthesis
MSKRLRPGAFTRGDPVSEALLALASDVEVELGPGAPAGLVELAQRHGLVPILGRYVQDPLVQAIAARERARGAVLLNHAHQVLAHLHDAGIATTVLKGPAVAARYQEPANRTFSDLDLMVREHEVEAALDVLQRYPSTVSVPEKRPKADKRDVLLQDDSGISFNVDLHWDLFSYSQLRGSADGATEAAWAEAQLEEQSPVGPVWNLPDGYRLAFLAAHAVLDHRFRLILFRDFKELARDDVDWEGVEEVAHRWDLRSTTYLALWIGKEALGAAVPDGLLESLRPSSLPVRFLEWALPRVDLIRFDGHRPHPVNLAAVLLNDSRRERLSLLLRAPAAFPGWRQRVTEEHHRPGTPRTLILASTNRRRGAEVFSERLRSGLIARGWVAEAVSLRGYDEHPAADLEALVTPASTSRFDVRIARALIGKVRSFRPEVVVANGGATLRYALAARPWRRFALVYVGIGEPQYWLRSRLSRWLNRFMLRRANHVLAVSDATRHQLLELEPSISARISTVYTGIPDDLFRLDPTVSTDDLHVLMIGSLTPEKDPGRALRAVAAIDRAQLRFVGSGPLEETLEQDARALGAGDRVEFTGSVGDVTPQLEWADVLILTSRSEGLPGAILEAGAAGVPTVAVDVGGVREAIVDGETGFVTRRDDHELIEALRTLDSDRELLVQMGKVAQDHVASRFAMEDVIDGYVKVLRHVAR